jgi:hypothetical protein
MARLVEQHLHAAWKHHRHCDPEAEVSGLAAELDALALKVGLRRLDVVADQAQFVVRRSLRRVDT